MSKAIVVAERDNIAAVIEDGKVCEFYVHRGDMLLNDVYLATVDNILPSIDWHLLMSDMIKWAFCMRMIR